MAFIDANAFDTHEAEIGLKWIRENQNPDGGFGGGKSVTWNNSKLGCSSVEETALCTEALLNHDDQQSRLAADRGVQWLIEAVESGEIESCSPIGFYFFKLWYYEKLYPLIFATSTLGRAIELKAY
jgi:squalene-hopene/tetraprenyl-beta-curcumene cyclase